MLTSREVGKKIGLTAQELHEFLHKHGWIKPDSKTSFGRWHLDEAYIKEGFGGVDTYSYFNKKEYRWSTAWSLKWTTKGAAAIVKFHKKAMQGSTCT